jgi:GNAT superfamily N-acetyltransferase
MLGATVLAGLGADVSDRPVLFDATNIGALQQLYMRCLDYFEMVEGPMPAPDATGELTAGPPERVPQDVFCFGIRNADGLVVAAVCFLRHYRQPDQWYLTLMLIDPLYRSRGLGRRLYAAFERWLLAQGAQSVLLAVVERNVRAKAFWESNGFVFQQRFSDVRIESLTHDRLEYEKSLLPLFAPT